MRLSPGSLRETARQASLGRVPSPTLPGALSRPSCPCSSGAVRYLMNVPGKVGEDLLLVSSEACVLLDGQELVPRWTLGAAQVLRYGVLLQGAGYPSVSPHPHPWRPWGQGPYASARGHRLSPGATLPLGRRVRPPGIKAPARAGAAAAYSRCLLQRPV